MSTLIKRNLKLFFRDKTAVFFSLLSILIIIGLYAIFLGDLWLSGSLEQLKDADILMNSWLVAGILAVAPLTTSLGAFGVMIDDKVKKISKDFNASPVKKSSIVAGYIGSSFTIGTIMSLITAVLTQLYMVAKGGKLLTLTEYAEVFFLILLTTMACTSIVSFIVSFFKSHSAFSTATTIIGTLIGFLTGIYLPMGSLPEAVQTVIKAFPVSHGAMLFRQIIMREAMEISFEGIPAQYLAEFKTNVGVTFTFGTYEVTKMFSIAVLIATTVLFFALTVLKTKLSKD